MKRMFCVLGVFVFIVFSVSVARAAEELSSDELFVNKCTQCHDAGKARTVHGSKKEAQDIVKKMQGKPGAKIADKDAEKIAAYLADPNRQAFEAKCSKCHTLTRVEQKHLTGDTAKKIVDNMSVKEGSDISPQEKQYIQDFLRYYFTIEPAAKK
jgi:cytochrome c5